MTNEIARTTITDQAEFARLVTSSTGQSILPDIYRANPSNVLVAVGLGQAMGLSPAESLFRISVIKGKPTANAELIASNVRRAGHKLRVRGDDESCTATIIRADDPDFEFTVARDMEWAKRMGLASNDNYKKQPGTMLQWRAITAVARLACPEALYGVTYTADELYDTDGGMPTVEPVEAVVEAAPEERVRMSRARGVRAIEAPADEVVEEEPATEEESGVETGEMITPAQLRALHASFRDAGVEDRAVRLTYCTQLIGRDVESANDLTKREASTVIDALKKDREDTKTAE